jgi:pimeloyl-ACP methyl ester carboxylesterase
VDNRLVASVFFALVACAPERAPVERGRASSDVRESVPAEGAPRVWAAPKSLQYRTVVEAGGEPALTVFIELPGGAAAAIDPASVTLNGSPALPWPVALGDDDGNGVQDLMVKFDRSVFEGNVEGGFVISGATPAGAFSAEGQVRLCTVADVERSEYGIDYTTSNMPDPQFDGLPARILVRRVKPVFAPSSAACEGAQALILVHGRTLEATTTFDLQYKDYSLMEGLARRGIETFAVNLLGFGGSGLVASPVDPLANPCNASLPQCAGSPCAPVAGVCDCQGLPPAPNQQGPAYLNLPHSCAHTSDHAFQSSDNQVADLERVVEDVRTKVSGRINLLGYSAGGPVAGVYLSDPARQSKIGRAIFMSSLFAQPDSPPPFPNWPLGLQNHGNASGGKSDPACPGQLEDGVSDAIWSSLKSRDPLGAAWGPPGAGGLNRFPIVARAGWNAAAARKVSIPLLALNGLKDVTVPGGATVASLGIVRNSPQANACATNADCAPGYVCETAFSPAVCRLNNRTYVQIPCASHSLIWESCSGPGCSSPHEQVKKYLGDFVLRGLVGP